MGGGQRSGAPRRCRHPHPGTIVNSESLVVNRTFGDLMDADEAQVDLLSAGIYSLLYTDEGASIRATVPGAPEIALAVHRRDMEIAEAVLTISPEPA